MAANFIVLIKKTPNIMLFLNEFKVYFYVLVCFTKQMLWVYKKTLRTTKTKKIVCKMVILVEKLLNI